MTGWDRSLGASIPTLEFVVTTPAPFLDITLHYLDREQPRVDLPLDVRAIPGGEIRTYGEVGHAGQFHPEDLL